MPLTEAQVPSFNGGGSKKNFNALGILLRFSSPITLFFPLKLEAHASMNVSTWL